MKTTILISKDNEFNFTETQDGELESIVKELQTRGFSVVMSHSSSDLDFHKGWKQERINEYQSEGYKLNKKLI